MDILIGDGYDMSRIKAVFISRRHPESRYDDLKTQSERYPRVNVRYPNDGDRYAV